MKRSLPPVELEYSQPQFHHEVVEVDAENLPQGIGGAYRLLDLDGEGLPGILTEQGDVWLYKRNVSPLASTAQFAPVELMPTRYEYLASTFPTLAGPPMPNE